MTASRKGVVLAFSGFSGAGTHEISQRVADRLGWRRIRFSDVIRLRARALGRDPADLRVLQEIGQALVQEELETFVTDVLSHGGWVAGGDLVLDGLRHAEVRTELKRQLGETALLHVVHIDMPESQRAARFGFDADAVLRHDSHVAEAQLAVVLPNYANLRLDGAQRAEDLVDLILRRFGHPDARTGPEDGGEDVGRLEPLLIRDTSRHFGGLANLAAQLLADSKDLSGNLPPGLRVPLAELVRAMNCYYSNLIEGHRTHPIDIERALKSEFAPNGETRDLQLEARAHIGVQAWIDQGGLTAPPTSEAALRQIHQRFCEQLPERLLWVADDGGGEKWRVMPGELRQHYVRVGLYVAPSPGALPRFLRRFEEGYGRLVGPVDIILGAAAAHHRLLWIHPFTDGNGRVARLMSHAALRLALDNHSLWSVARGLGRQRDKYKQHLQACDLPRRNDLDGRGPLSEETLTEFTRFFLEVCLDQVQFMAQLMEPSRLRPRLNAWVAAEAESGRTPASAARLLNALLFEEQIPRSEAADALGLERSKAEAAITHLEEEGLLATAGINQLRFAFPAKLVEILVPGLFP
jgi:Fic family protein